MWCYSLQSCECANRQQWMRQDIKSTEHEDNGAQYLKENPLPPPLNVPMKCATPPKIRSQPSSSAIPTAAVAGLTIANKPNKMSNNPGQTLPTRETLGRLDNRTFGCHLTPPGFRLKASQAN